MQLLSLAGINGISTCSTSYQNLVQYRWILDHWGLGFLVQRRGSMPWKQSVCQEVQLWASWGSEGRNGELLGSGLVALLLLLANRIRILVW